jgi:hypothetical protein
MSGRSQGKGFKAFRQAGLPLLLFVGGGFWGLSYILEGNRSVKVLLGAFIFAVAPKLHHELP